MLPIHILRRIVSLRLTEATQQDPDSQNTKANKTSREQIMKYDVNNTEVLFALF